MTTIELLRGAVNTIVGPERIIPWPATLAIAAVGWWILSSWLRPVSKFPTINDPKENWTSFPAKKAYLKNCQHLLKEGARKFSGPFNLTTDNGTTMLIFSPEYIDAINEQESLSFPEYAIRNLNLKGYKTFRTFGPQPDHMFYEAVIKGLTRNLAKFTKPLSLEMDACLLSSWGESTEWHSVEAKEDVLDFVARLSSLIFLGPDFVHNKEWIRIAKNYTVDTFTAIAICRYIPALIRPLFVQFLPLCRKVRRDYTTCANILAPVLASREAELKAAKSESRPPNLPDDAIEWFRNAAHGREYNQTDVQVSLQVASIHTTTDLLAQAILNLCAHPEMVAPLREEAIAVLSTQGWQKTALTSLHLLDSFLKETQRLKPINFTSLHRYATRDTTLSGGIHIPQGTNLGIHSYNLFNPDIYTSPETFDGYRYLRLRQSDPKWEHKGHLVSTSVEHTGFAHGKSACPGRFFAANEVKIAMVHVLLKYDVKVERKEDAMWITYGPNCYVNPKARMWVRRRREEVDLEALARE
ncbi:unnamed protein product [Zymoseptoria tritici ST99CH_3D1]|nr:unnamed protein product [Zymoseptoria tritici ST99CH_3D1]